MFNISPVLESWIKKNKTKKRRLIVSLLCGFMSLSPLCTNVFANKHMGVSMCERILYYCVSVFVFVCPCQHMQFPLSPLAVCVCHYPAGAALMEAVISNAVN